MNRSPSLDQLRHRPGCTGKNGFWTTAEFAECPGDIIYAIQASPSNPSLSFHQRGHCSRNGCAHSRVLSRLVSDGSAVAWNVLTWSGFPWEGPFLFWQMRPMWYWHICQTLLCMIHLSSQYFKVRLVLFLVFF